MQGFLWYLVVCLKKVFADSANFNLRTYEDTVLAQHQFKLIVACDCESRYEEWLTLLLVLAGFFEALDCHVSNLFQHFTGLARQDAKENDVTLLYYFFIVELCDDAEFVLERSEQVWLSSGDVDLQVIERSRDLEHFGEDHCAEVTATYYSNLKRCHFAHELNRVVHKL